MADQEARLHRPAGTVTQNAGAERNPGEVLRSNDGRPGYVTQSKKVASGDDHGLQVDGVIAIVDKDGNAMSAGDDVYWDASAGQAVAPGLAMDGGSDLYLGTCVEDAAAGDDTVKVELNEYSRYEKIRPFVFEFDVDGDNGDTNDHVLIPAEMNHHGLLVLGVYGVVTEVPAGSSQDQGVVTVEDEDDNSLATLTFTDAGADAVDDIIVGYQAGSASTGDAAKTVAADKDVHGFVSTQTSGGTPAGKMKVYVIAVPLV